MHSSGKRGDQPRNHSKREKGFWKGRNWMTFCPLCNQPKRCTSALCNRCKFESKITPVSKEIFFIDGEPCRWIGLTKGQKTIVDADNYEWLSNWRWNAHYDKHTRSFYVRRGGLSGLIQMHRLIEGGKHPYVDHRNHNTLDNRRSNLRGCNGQQSAANERLKKNNTSGYKGVAWNKSHKKWAAYIGWNRKMLSLGFFTDPIEAARVYDQAAIRLFGEFAFTNFPNNDSAQ